MTVSYTHLEMIRIEQRGVILVGPLVVLRVVDSFKIRRGAVAVPDLSLIHI